MFILKTEKIEYKRKRTHDQKKKASSCDYDITFVMWCGSWIVDLNVNSNGTFVLVLVVETPIPNRGQRKAGICIIVLCNNFNCV